MNARPRQAPAGVFHLRTGGPVLGPQPGHLGEVGPVAGNQGGVVDQGDGRDPQIHGADADLQPLQPSELGRPVVEIEQVPVPVVVERLTKPAGREGDDELDGDAVEMAEDGDDEDAADDDEDDAADDDEDDAADDEDADDADDEDDEDDDEDADEDEDEDEDADEDEEADEDDR